MKLYDYFYYHFFKLQKNGSMSAIAPFCFCQSLNVLTLYLILCMVLNEDIFVLTQLFALFLFLFIVVINLAYLLINKKHKRIIEKYYNINDKERKNGRTIVVLYMVFTVIFFFVIVAIKANI